LAYQDPQYQYNEKQKGKMAENFGRYYLIEGIVLTGIVAMLKSAFGCRAGAFPSL
jgi:hypothetical protein